MKSLNELIHNIEDSSTIIRPSGFDYVVELSPESLIAHSLIFEGSIISKPKCWTREENLTLKQAEEYKRKITNLVKRKHGVDTVWIIKHRNEVPLEVNYKS